MTALLEVKNLVKHFVADRSVFGRPTAFIKAVDGISFSVDAGETLALVGESGCGKSTVSRLVLRLIEPDSGHIRFEGRDLLALDANQLRAFRRDAQIIFQDPYASLNPRMTVSQILTEPLALHDLVPPPRRRERVEELLRLVGLEPRFARRYPHTNFPAASASASPLPARWRWNRNWSSATSRYRRWMCQSARRSSTCCAICRTGSASPTSSSRMTSPSSSTSPTASP
jgi:ABC-type antimicrobial peptide transport system ATPase subunit